MWGGDETLISFAFIKKCGWRFKGWICVGVGGLGVGGLGVGGVGGRWVGVGVLSVWVGVVWVGVVGWVLFGATNELTFPSGTDNSLSPNSALTSSTESPMGHFRRR